MSQLETIKMLLFTPGMKENDGLPALFQAGPGGGKTSLMRVAAALYGLKLKTLAPGSVGEGMFGVVPMPVTVKRGTKSRTVLSYPAPDWVDIFRDEKTDAPIPGLVFIDDALAADRVIRPAFLNLIDERVMGDTYMGACVRVLAATNSADTYGTDDLLAPAANRLIHPTWENFTPDEFGNNLTSGLPLSQVQAVLDPVDEMKRVTALFPAPYAKVAALVAGFHRKTGGKFLVIEPPAGDPKGSKAWPSMRSWELATRAMAGCAVHGFNQAKTDSILQSTVGEDAASAFITYRTEMDLPDPADVLDGKVPFEIDPSRLDRTYVILESCASFALSPNIPKRAERGAFLWNLLGKIGATTPDLIIKPATMLAQGKPPNADPKVALPVMAPHRKLTEIIKLLQASK